MTQPERAQCACCAWTSLPRPRSGCPRMGEVDGGRACCAPPAITPCEHLSVGAISTSRAPFDATRTGCTGQRSWNGNGRIRKAEEPDARSGDTGRHAVWSSSADPSRNRQPTDRAPSRAPRATAHSAVGRWSRSASGVADRSDRPGKEASPVLPAPWRRQTTRTRGHSGGRGSQMPSWAATWDPCSRMQIENFGRPTRP